MRFFIDRRLNPGDRSLGNRQRFLRRARAEVKAAVNRTLRDRGVAAPVGDEKVNIPASGIGEPRFRSAPGCGRVERVLPGNKSFSAGDRLPRPPGGGRGGKGADGGGEQDALEFALSRDEFMDLFFEDLELPDLVKTTLAGLEKPRPRRAGISTTGTPTHLNVIRTMRAAQARRLALRRPGPAAVRHLTEKLLALEGKAAPTPADRAELAKLRAELLEMKRRQRAIPYIDPLDIRYNRFTRPPEPATRAVMFCLMDVSGSMGEREKDLARRFFVLLHLFLTRRYEKIAVVFIRHTHKAREVDEETFFHGRETGGTVVSTALETMRDILHRRYPPEDWNIYAAQASDGDNFAGDSEKCIDLLCNALLPFCQYYAYIEILDEREMELFGTAGEGAALWRAFRQVAAEWPRFAMQRIAGPGDIYPVFRKLFAPGGR